MARRNIYIREDIWQAVRSAAADEGAARGKPMPVSEWLRLAITARLEADAKVKA